MAINGDTVVVGARGDDDNGNGSGSAYIFSRNQGGPDNWGQVTKLTAADGAANDRFGEAVAISGDTVVVGAYGDDGNRGSAYIYVRRGNSWQQVTNPTAEDGTWSAYLGYAVAISGDTVVVGAWGDDDQGSETGTAYIFSRNRGGADNWGQVKKLTATDVAAYRFNACGTVGGPLAGLGCNGRPSEGS